MTDRRVSAAEFIANFDTMAERALTEPLTITEGGRERLVVSVEEFQRLRRRECRVYRAENIPDDLADTIAATEPPPEAHAAELEVNSEPREPLDCLTTPLITEC